MSDRFQNTRAYKVLDVFIKAVVRGTFVIGAFCAFWGIAFCIIIQLDKYLSRPKLAGHWTCKYFGIRCPRYAIYPPLSLAEVIFWGTLISALIFTGVIFQYKLIFSQPMFAGSRASRLAMASKEITDKFDNANATQRRKAALDTCLVAIKQRNLNNETVDKATDLLTAGKIDQSLATALASLSNKSDERYFELEEQKGRDAESLEAFYEARIFAALAFAMASDSTALHDSIYEALKACSNEAEALEAANKALDN